MMTHNQEHRRVLVVDDEEVIASMMSAILAEEGYETRTAANADEAIAKAHHFQPDLLLTDVCMPGRNGIETAHEVVSVCPACKIVFISGYGAAAHLVAEARAQGLTFLFLSKPLAARELLREIAGLFEDSGSEIFP